MLAITDTRNSDGVPGLSTDFLVASIELLDDSSLRIWFTRPVLNGSITANYSVSGSSVKNVILAQYETDIRGVRIYLDAPLSIGQWVIQFRSGPPGTLISNDSDHFILPSNTQVVIDLVDKSSQDSVGTNLVESPVGQFIPKEFRSKKVYSAIVAGIEAGDKIVSDQARLAFDQYFVSTASDKYLTTRAADRGIQKPEKLGIADADFRNLVIDVSNNKLTNDALLSVLEIMYGPDSVRGYVETAIVEPFEIFDGAYLDFLIDGKTKFRFTANWVDYQTPLRATGVELSSALNFAFDKNGINAYATVENSKVRVYSNTKGIQSSVSIQGGTLQPYVEFDSPVYGAFSPTQQQSLEWILINPSVGIVRFMCFGNFTGPHIADLSGGSSNTVTLQMQPPGSSDPSTYVDLTFNVDSASVLSFCDGGQMASQNTVADMYNSVLYPAYDGWNMGGMVSNNMINNYGPLNLQPPTNFSLGFSSGGEGGAFCLFDPLNVAATFSTGVVQRPIYSDARLQIGMDMWPKDVSNGIVHDFRAPTLRIGDYVTVVGSNFPVELRGSWPVVDVSFVFNLVDGTLQAVEWFDIASDYIVP